MAQNYNGSAESHPTYDKRTLQRWLMHPFVCISWRRRWNLFALTTDKLFGKVRQNGKKRKRIRRTHIGTHASPGDVSCAVHLVKGGLGWVWQSPSVCCPPCNGGMCEKVINMTSASVEVFRRSAMDRIGNGWKLTMILTLMCCFCS